MELKNKIARFLKDESGLTATEYAIAGGLVGLAVVTSFTNLGTAVGGVIDNIITAINGA
jgi:pilus assembly protein Flp/PilA